MRSFQVLPTFILLLAGSAWALDAPPIATGVLYCYGHYIRPPYRIEATDSTVTINGLRVEPRLSAVKADLPLVVPEYARRHHALCDRVWALEREERQRGTPLDSITAGVVAILRSDTTLVASVTATEPGSIWVLWRDTGYREELLVTAGPVVPRTPVKERMQKEAERFRRHLQRGGVLIISSSATKSFPPPSAEYLAEIRREIERARVAPDHELTEDAWDGKILPTEIAREFKHPLPLKEDER